MLRKYRAPESGVVHLCERLGDDGSGGGEGCNSTLSAAVGALAEYLLCNAGVTDCAESRLM